MITIDFLKKIGFVDFVQLRPELRDSHKRLTRVVVLAKHLLTIQLIFQNDCWQIEKLLYSGDEALLKKFIPPEMSLSQIIDVFFPLSNDAEGTRILQDPYTQ